jgi:hypothetical protein
MRRTTLGSTGGRSGRGCVICNQAKPYNSADGLFIRVKLVARVLPRQHIPLDGFDARFDTASGDKETRAKPVSTQKEAHNIKIMRGLWNDEFLRVLKSLPAGKHDDEVDGLRGLGRRRGMDWTRWAAAANEQQKGEDFGTKI